MGSFNWGAAAGGILSGFGGASGIGASLGLSPGLSSALGTIGSGISQGYGFGGAGAPAPAPAQAFSPGTTVQQRAAVMPTFQQPPLLRIPGAAGAAGGTGASGPSGPANGGGFGADKYVDMARGARRAWDAWRGSRAATEVQELDILTLSQVDDREIAKLAVKHGVIPAYSDLGTALQMAGAKVTKRRVKMSDGTVQVLEVISAVGAKKRRRRNYATKAGIRNAGRTLRQMGQQVRTYKTLARLGAKIDRALSPKRTAATGAKRRVTRKR